MSVLSTQQLTRRFGEILALDSLDLEIEAGGVVGLVGPNGSGKSTLIRLLLGLIRPTSGSAQVLGLSVSRPRAYAERVGALIENPAFVPSLSARSNLRALARLRGISNRRVEEVLDVVGLSDRAGDRAGRYSLGMKQRLGIAAALLPDPELLVLDEPTNGLDPAGIVEVRDLIRSLGEDGRTVVVSSHLLSEIEAACGHLVVIRYGELLFSGPLDDLVGRAGERLEAVPEHARDLERLEQVLAEHGWEVELGDGAVSVRAGAAQGADVNRAAGAAGITLGALSPREARLEEVFLSMTGEWPDDHEPAALDAGPTAGKAGRREVAR